ncbi:MAG TPA: hypothetical protein VGM57_17230 [Pseudolabrys sp.]|jgi:hypothetical protein
MQVVAPFKKRIDRPSCRCGAYMRIWMVEPLVTDPTSEAHVFFCDRCGHKMHMLHNDAYRLKSLADQARQA